MDGIKRKTEYIDSYGNTIYEEDTVQLVFEYIQENTSKGHFLNKVYEKKEKVVTCKGKDVSCIINITTLCIETSSCTDFSSPVEHVELKEIKVIKQ